MHHATRERLLAAMWECEERRDDAFVAAGAKLGLSFKVGWEESWSLPKMLNARVASAADTALA